MHLEWIHIVIQGLFVLILFLSSRARQLLLDIQERLFFIETFTDLMLYGRFCGSLLLPLVVECGEAGLASQSPYTGHAPCLVCGGPLLTRDGRQFCALCWSVRYRGRRVSLQRLRSSL
ncbi:hypothetical protein BDV33DRAFT_75493 [Aspergillus novoparasiticus]|uniref:Uncharacterized protein n=1 Tax=Aspergillus novoparasiticus TaxID=986946 RepID=A0A5N6E8Q7_9EURO|nr:hypothetical protein BDV33DRAFT_75493 [Aspergillus novoparasiticus]